MTINCLRRSLLLAACAASALLSACGSSTVDSAITPTRIVAFGDGLSDVGQTGARYTVNDGGINIWAAQFASNYGRSLSAVAAGGTGYARGHARISEQPDASAVSTSLNISQQIDAFLAADALASNDMAVMNGGISDIISQMADVTAGRQTPDQMVANATAAGRAMAAQARRLTASGGRYVVVVGTYDLGRSPWAARINQVDLLSRASSAFNSALLVGTVDLGNSVLYIDAAYYFNLLIHSPSNYNLDNSRDPVCTSVDAGNGIGTGSGQVNSFLCTPSTLLPNADASRYAFADGVYFSPAAHRLFGNYAYDRVRLRW